MKALLALLRPPLLNVAALSFFVNLLLLTPALFMLQVYDRVLASQSGATLAVLSLGMVIALVLMLVLDYLRGRLQGVAGNLLGESLAPLVARISIAEGARRNGRASPEALRDVGALRAVFSAQGLLALFDAPWVVIYVGVIWLAHPVLGITAAAAALLMLALALLNDFVTRRHIEALQTSSAGATRYLEASMHGAEVAQALGMTDALIARWRQKNVEVTALQQPTAVRTVAMAALTRTLRQGLQVLMLATAGWLVIQGQATAGVMIAATILLGRALAPVELMIGGWRTLAGGRAALRRLAATLDAADAGPERMALPPPQGRLQVDKLAFRAPQGDRLLLDGISLQLEPGQSLGIIGASGAGKSTLLRLLTGVWQPTAGTVRLDLAELSQCLREDIGPCIGYVPQDVELFAGTVAENIARLGKVDADAVARAAVRAQAYEMILQLPDGFDTVVDPSGAVISPGQRQRIALARALYGEPRLVLLDEPNANLDAEGEAGLARALQALRGQATVVVVSHRSTLMQQMDRLMVLAGGRVQHHGATAEVLAALSRRPAARAAGGSASVGGRVISMTQPAGKSPPAMPPGGLQTAPQGSPR